MEKAAGRYVEAALQLVRTKAVRYMTKSMNLPEDLGPFASLA
jgi:hypothetical protein